MNTPVIAVIIAALIAGSALAIMNKASKSGYQALCARIFTLQDHYSAGCLITAADLRYRTGGRHSPS
jgi:ABC-type uncharacterized transport system permease subunit